VAVKVEVGTWTGSGSSPQTITLADGAFGTPIAIIAWMTGQATAPSSGSFAAVAIQSMGFGTRQGGTTQQGTVCAWLGDDISTGATSRGRQNSKLLYVPSAQFTPDYTVSLSSFGDASFTVAYSSAANASGDIFHYKIISGLDNAIVLNWLMDSTGATEVVTGTGFQPVAMLALDIDEANNNSLDSTVTMSFGCATSAAKFWSVALTATSGDTMTSTMNWNRAVRSDACLERLTVNADTSDARWDLDSFDSDGATLGVVDAPSNTNRVCPLLFIQGGTWEAGTFAKSTTITGGAQTVTLADASLTPVGVLLGTTNQTAVGISEADATMCLGAGSTPSTTRGSAVNNCLGITGPEAINTTADRFRATDAIIEELTGGTTPAETSEAWYRSASAGAFGIEWANPNGTVAHLIGYLAVGAAAVANVPSAQPRSFVPVAHASHW
jgi:hypothetical protein